MVLYTASAETGHVDPAMRRLPLYFVLLMNVLLLAPSEALAVRIEGLYRAEVEVVDKGGDARAEGFRVALEDVLVKVTGHADVVSDPALEPVLEQARRYVQQYRYEPIERGPDALPEDEVTDAENDNGEAGEEEALARYRLEVVFGKRRIDGLLSERDIPIWDVYRPQILIWLAFDDGRRRTLVAADDGSDIDAVLQAAAQRRGLPLLLPLLDTEDRRRIEYLDIQGGFHDRVREASARYQAGLILTGHVFRSGGAWRGEWTLLDADERRGWLTRADEAADAVHSGLGALAEHLASTLAGREGDLRKVRVRVSNAVSLGDYARLGRYFEEMPRVDNQRVVQVRPEDILFELSLRGQLSDLERAIALDNLLVPVRPAGRLVTAGVEVSAVEAANDEEGPGAVESDPSGGPAYGLERDDDADNRSPVGGADLIYRLAG